MAVTNYERVGKAMELLRQGLAPFVEREVQDKIQAGAVRMAAIRRFVDDPKLAVAYLLTADNVSRLNPIRRRDVNQPIIRSRNPFATPRLPPLGLHLNTPSRTT